MSTLVPGTVLFRATRVGVAYGARTVLRDVSLEIREGEYWFLLGRNGAGKTTFLHALLGTQTVSAGELWRDPGRASAQRIGFVPQRVHINPSLPTTVRELALLGLVGTPAERRADDRLDRLAWALEQVGLAHLERRSYWALSGGERQRAVIARALIRRPRILVLDEPMNSLDLTAEAQMLGLLAKLNADGVTVVYVTHKLAVARRFGTHTALFAEQRVLAGEVARMLTPANLAEAFGLEVDTPLGGAGGATGDLAVP